MEMGSHYKFDGPDGSLSLLDLFAGRRQLIVYRAFFEPGVFGWPERPCRGCSMVADQVAHVAHLNARDTTLVFASRAQQADIAAVKERMGWTMPWVTITDDFDVDLGVHEWHGTNAFIRHDDARLPDLLHRQPRRRVDGRHLGLPRHHRPGSPGEVGGLARRATPQSDPYSWWNWHDSYEADAAPDEEWLAKVDGGVEALGGTKRTDTCC